MIIHNGPRDNKTVSTGSFNIPYYEIPWMTSYNEPLKVFKFFLSFWNFFLLQNYNKYNKSAVPVRQQKSAKKSSKRYLMFGSNHILVTLRWDDGRSPGHGKVCWWFLKRYKKLLGPWNLGNRVFLGKCWKWNLSKSLKFLRYMDNFFSRLMSFHYLQIASYK